MQAIVSHKYGELELAEIDKPELEPGRVLVRVRAASVNALDAHEIRGRPLAARPLLGLTKPKQSRRGVDFAGVVEAVADDVAGFARGDEVFGTGRGSFGEYVRPLPTNIALKPASLSFEQAAALPVAGVTALQGVRDKGRVHAGQRVLVNGAGGGVGHFALQIAKSLGAEVTAVCSTGKVELVRSLGADAVVDYTRDDFTRDRGRYDVIVNCATGRSLRELKRALKSDGRLVMAGGGIGQMLFALTVGRFAGRAVVPFLAKITTEDLRVLAELVEAGKVRPVIDRTYLLREAPAAVRVLEAGHTTGKLVVTV